MSLKIRKNDEVMVIAGKDKGTRGRVLKVVTDKSRIIVEGVNVVKRHRRVPNQKGTITEKEASIHISNVMLIDKKANKPTRVRSGKDKDGRKVRVSVKTGNVLDE